MLLLAVAVLAVTVLFGVILRLSRGLDPHHEYAFALLPCLDLEHTAGTRSDESPLQVPPPPALRLAAR